MDMNLMHAFLFMVYFLQHMKIDFVKYKAVVAVTLFL